MKRLLAGGAAVSLLVACGAGSGPEAGIDYPELAQVPSQIQPAHELRAGGRTLLVPSAKYPTIASALAVAQLGDRVRVAAGTYAECLNLVDGVALEGHIVSGEPAATLDGTGCPTCVVCGDASIVHGAGIQGFRIVNSLLGYAMDLIGSRGVQISEMSIESPRAGGIRSERSSFTLTRSRVLDNRARPGVRISLGSQAVLVGNDIQGATNGVRVEMGRFYEEPGWAPSEALLLENRIRATGTAGLWVQGRGTRVQGAGNRYEGSTAEGVHVSGGASYVGWRDSMSDNQGNGLRALGCELLCRAAGCTDPRDPVFVQEPTFATLESATILRNRQVGVYVGCGASARITEAVVSGNQDGLMVQSPVALDGAHIGSMPARLEIVHSRVTGNLVSGAVVLSTPYADDEWAEAAIDARDTVFAGHTGIWLLGKGALGRGWGNRYEHGTYGLHVSGGASYFGKQDTMADNGDFGVFALGHEVMCDVPGCGSVGIVRGSSRVRLVGAVARGNGAGLLATCGATIELLGSHITSSRWEGAVAYSSCDWGDMGVSSAPSDIRSRGSVFAENGGFGLMAWEDSQLRLGSLYDPGRNSFVGNLGGAIANYSTACVPALWNWFGTADEGAIAASLMGCVEFVPFLTQAP